MSKYMVLKEEYTTPEFGKVTKQGKRIIFASLPLQISCDADFKNMQEVKEFLFKNKKKMENILSKYVELCSKSKGGKSTSVPKIKIIEETMRRLGYIQ